MSEVVQAMMIGSPRLASLQTQKARQQKRLHPRRGSTLDRETARAATVTEATDRAERGGAHNGLVIADQPVSPALRAALEEVEHCHGSPAGTTTFAGRWIAIVEGQSAVQESQSSQQPPPAEPQPAQET